MGVECTEKYRKERRGKCLYNMPAEGTDTTEIVEKFRALSAGSRKYYAEEGNISGAVYCSDLKHWGFIAEV